MRRQLPFLCFRVYVEVSGNNLWKIMHFRDCSVRNFYHYKVATSLTWFKIEFSGGHWYLFVFNHQGFVSKLFCKGKVVPVLKDVWGSGSIAPRILDPGTRWRWVVSFTSRPLYHQGKSSRYQLDRRIGGPQNEIRVTHNRMQLMRPQKLT
jgi:hypothetical protein